MKLLSYERADGTWAVGALGADGVHHVAEGSLLDFIRSGNTPQLGEKVTGTPRTRLGLRPPKLFCIGRNYADHASELGNPMPTKPLVFAKYPTCVIEDGDLIRWRADITQQVDWEVELAVVISKDARDVREDRAYDVVFGYTVANDVSARDLQNSEGQWTRAKGMDTFCPLGPVIVTQDELPDPHTLDLETRVNGERMQYANTRQMHFRIPFLIAYLSQTFTLEAGDVILTGTPAGVGSGMKPPRFLADGDEVRVSVQGIGALTNRCAVLR